MVSMMTMKMPIVKNVMIHVPPVMELVNIIVKLVEKTKLKKKENVLKETMMT